MPIVTLSVQRIGEDHDHKMLCSEPASYPLAVGSLVHLAQEREGITCATKKLSTEKP